MITMKLEIYQVGKLPPLTVIECDEWKIDSRLPQTLDIYKNGNIIAAFFTNNIAGFKEIQDKAITIVSVMFNNNTNKFYDYKYIGNETVFIGDTVIVETPYQEEPVEVKVVKVFQKLESELQYDYKIAKKN